VWQTIADEVEFGVTATVGGVTEQTPSAFESGYNGAWVFASPIYYGMGQTFTVPSSRALQSIELRVGGVNNQPASGQFEVAVYLFDPLSNAPRRKLASVLADAQSFDQIDLTKVPVTSFDFSSFNILLDPAETYALSATPTSTYAGGALTLQAAQDIYPHGNPYSLSLVPEPGAVALFGCGLLLFLVWPHDTHDKHRTF